MSDLFLGSWRLVPEVSLYEFGDPPRSGDYTLAAEGDVLHVSIAWVDAQGEPGHTEYGGPMDGSEIPVDDEGSPVLTLHRVDERTLDSAVRLAGKQVAGARRVASEDGALLAVVQTGRTPEGQPFRNFSLFKRVRR